MRFGRPQFADAQEHVGYCQYCSNRLKKVPVNSRTMASPFNKNEPAVICATCDGPGQLPPVEVTAHA